MITWSTEASAAAIARAPERVEDPECPYDPNDAAAVADFWKGATVRRTGRREGRAFGPFDRGSPDVPA